MGTPAYTHLCNVLEQLVVDAELKAVLLVDKGGHCIASHGDRKCMEDAAVTHFSQGLSLATLRRDADGCTVVSGASADAVRFEAVASGRCILTLVTSDPLSPSRMRPSIDAAKRQLDTLIEALVA